MDFLNKRNEKLLQKKLKDLDQKYEDLDKKIQQKEINVQQQHQKYAIQNTKYISAQTSSTKKIGYENLSNTDQSTKEILKQARNSAIRNVEIKKIYKQKQQQQIEAIKETQIQQLKNLQNLQLRHNVLTIIFSFLQYNEQIELRLTCKRWNLSIVKFWVINLTNDLKQKIQEKENQVQNEEFLKQKEIDINEKMEKFPVFAQKLKQFVSKSELQQLLKLKFNPKLKIINQLVSVLHLIFIPQLLPKTEMEYWLNVSKFKDLYQQMQEFQADKWAEKIWDHSFEQGNLNDQDNSYQNTQDEQIHKYINLCRNIKLNKNSNVEYIEKYCPQAKRLFLWFKQMQKLVDVYMDGLGLGDLKKHLKLQILRRKIVLQNIKDLDLKYFQQE